MKITLTAKQQRDPKVAQLLATLSRALDALADYGVRITGPDVEAQHEWEQTG